MEFMINSVFSADSPTSLKYADVIVHVADTGAGKRFKAHKMVLAQYSPYFDRIFQYVGNMPFVHVCFHTYHPSIVENAIKLLYGHPVEILAKYSKKFCEFLKVLEVEYRTETIKEIDGKKNISATVVPNTVAVDFNQKNLESDKSEDEIEKRNNDRRRKANFPEKQPPEKERRKESTYQKPSNSSRQSYDKWTETTEERLNEIDFDVIITEAGGKIYKCQHCENIQKTFFYAEKHFTTKHQDPGDAPKILKEASIFATSAKSTFADFKNQINQGCNMLLAKNTLLGLVEDLREHMDKLESLEDKKLYRNLKQKKSDFISQLGNVIQTIEYYLEGLN